GSPTGRPRQHPPVTAGASARRRCAGPTGRSRPTAGIRNPSGPARGEFRGLERHTGRPVRNQLPRARAYRRTRMSQSLTRGLHILGELAATPRSLDELVQTMGVHKTTVLRLLRAMERERFVRRDDQHRYSLGARRFELGTSSLQQHSIRDVALPHLKRLGTRTDGQTVHLAAYEDDRAVYIAKVESTNPVRMYSRIGLSAPLHATA